MPLKTIEARREYQRARRARLKTEKDLKIVASAPSGNIGPIVEDLVDNIEPLTEDLPDNIEDQNETSESDSEGTSACAGDWKDMVEEISAPKEQAGSFSKIIMALVLSIAMPVIGLVVERLGGSVGMNVSDECAAIKKKDLNQSEQSAQPPTTSLAAPCDSIDGLGLKFT